jgi:helix-hairpin-helix protein
MPKSTQSAAPFPKGVAKPAIRALAAAGFTTLDQLANASEKQLAALHGMGPKALEILRRALEERGKPLRP